MLCTAPPTAVLCLSTRPASPTIAEHGCQLVWCIRRVLKVSMCMCMAGLLEDMDIGAPGCPFSHTFTVLNQRTKYIVFARLV